MVTALFPASAAVRSVGLTVTLAIVVDCVMTFFGPAAYDAAFNAYVTDVTTVKDRGRAMAVVEMVTGLAMLVV